jgi:hypothetical protein
MVSFRPTFAQALAHGGLVGLVVGLVLTLLAAVVILVVSPVRVAAALWAAIWAAPLAGLLLGALIAAVFGRERGSDIDDLGIHPVPRRPGEFAPWQRIEDVRAERRGGRTHVAVYLDSGRLMRLPAPYDGRLLAGDAQFERKLFMLRNLWETHRSYTVESNGV